MHSSTMPDATAIMLKPPPQMQPKHLNLHIWEPFNTTQYFLSLAQGYPLFTPDLIVTPILPSCDQTNPHVTTNYYMHRCYSDAEIIAGAKVIDTCRLCPEIIFHAYEQSLQNPIWRGIHSQWTLSHQTNFTF